MDIKHYEGPHPTVTPPRPDLLLFFVLTAIAVVGASAFAIGYILIAAATP